MRPIKHALYIFSGHCGGVCRLNRSVMSHSAVLWTVACQAPLSVEFSRQEYWSGLPFPSPVNLPGGKAGIENTSLAPVALEGGFLTLHYQGSLKSTRGQPKAPFNRKAKLRTFLTVTNCYKKATGSTKDVHPRQWSSIAV